MNKYNNNNWSEYPNIDWDVGQHLDDCEWYLVCDLIEVIIQKLNQRDKEIFINEINEYFITNGIGWKIVNDQIETRGDEVFETAIRIFLETIGIEKVEINKSNASYR